MKIWKRILLILAVTLLTGMGTVAAWQRNTLEALKYAATMDQEKILTEIQENEQTLERVMKEYALHGENLTAEDIQKLQSGQMTEEEAIEKLLTPVGEAPGADGDHRNPASTGILIREGECRRGCRPSSGRLPGCMP